MKLIFFPKVLFESPYSFLMASQFALVVVINGGGSEPEASDLTINYI